MVRTKKFAVNDRVMCRATRFDDGVDGQGRKWSDNHFRKTKSRWVVGTVKRLLVSGQVKVKWDGDGKQYESSPTHLIKRDGDESDSDDDDAASGSENDGEEGSGSGSDSNVDEVVVPIAEERNPEANMDERADGDEDIGEASDDEGGELLKTWGTKYPVVPLHGRGWSAWAMTHGGIELSLAWK